MAADDRTHKINCSKFYDELTELLEVTSMDIQKIVEMSVERGIGLLRADLAPIFDDLKPPAPVRLNERTG